MHNQKAGLSFGNGEIQRLTSYGKLVRYPREKTIHRLEIHTGGPCGTSAQVEACLIAMLLLEATPRVIACLLANLKGEIILNAVKEGRKRDLWTG